MARKLHAGLALACLILLGIQVSAWWQLGCSKPVIVARIDPIINPGVPGSHAHTIMGGNAINFTTDFTQAQTSSCTTCGITQDLSNYWVPNLYFRAQNGSFIEVEQLGGATVYYRQLHDQGDPENGTKVYAFPDNFRMVTGDPMRRESANTGEPDPIQWACSPASPEGNTPWLPKRKCGGNIVMSINFPSCWDGKNVDSHDHKSHVAYRQRMDTGPCPAGFPKRIMLLVYELTFLADKFDDLWWSNETVDQPFVLSHGDPTGYGLHGDFLNGWNQTLLQEAIDVCGDYTMGDITRCQVFNTTVYRNATQTNFCNKTDSPIDEPVHGVLPKLPGNNPVLYGFF